MKIEGIKTAKKISEHLYRIGKDIEPEDLLRIIRMLSGKGKELAGDYYHDRGKLYFTEVAGITRSEFHQILTITRESHPSLEDIIDGNFTREALIDQLSSRLKVKRSTTKRDLLYKALNEEILYELFRELIVKRKCQEWKSYIDGKILIRSQDNELQIIFSEKNPYRKSLSDKFFTQFWVLRKKGKSHTEPIDYKTRCSRDTLFLNLKDTDEVLLGAIKRIVQSQGETEDNSKFSLEVWQKEVSPADIGITEDEEITYENDIDKLSEYFVRRRGSKFETFSSGLKEMADKKLIKELLGKEFLVSEYNESIFIGKSLDKTTFERVASHLKLKYIEGKNIICKVEEKETSEVISAIWQMAGEYSKGFQMRALDERRKKKC